jgi:hypothetical protein
MGAVCGIATVCLFASVIGGVTYSQGLSTTSDARKGTRTTTLNGVSSISGHPFSAVVEIEHNQTLADGSHIHTVQHSKIFRDGDGHIRGEVYSHPPGADTSDEPQTVQILDVNSNTQYLLHPNSHTAQRTVVFFPALDAPATPRPNLSPIPNQAVQTKSSVETLGAQTIEGVNAEGRRTTTTWPINMVGNDAPLSMVNETWNSAELGFKVMTKITDPRSGETITRLQKINLGEQDPSLFQLPPDYKVTVSGPQFLGDGSF